MGVSPYKWPHERQWEPGIHDKRANRGMWFVLVIFAGGCIGVFLTLSDIPGDGLFLLLLMGAILAVLVVFFLVGQTSRRDVQVEELKYFAIPPDWLSEVVVGVLDDAGIGHRRNGPHSKCAGRR